LVREAGGTISGIEGSDDPLKTGHVLCANEYVHGELPADAARLVRRHRLNGGPPMFAEFASVGRNPQP
jgi:hypothetical protein